MTAANRPPTLPDAEHDAAPAPGGDEALCQLEDRLGLSGVTSVAS
jgi:hypothetical protein